jgi:signal transduction histidine kinase/DNA-binding NarL/FixJ family response regulator
MMGGANPAGAPRLFGREQDLEKVHAALADAGARVVVARGPGGVGKTALLRRVLQDARSSGALCGAGKYGEGHAGRDLDPLIAAVEGAVAAGLEQLYDPDAGLRDLARAVGENTHVFASVGGGLLRTLAGGSSATPITAERADAQLAQALIQVLHWLEGFGAPVLLLIDDWGRAGPQAQRTLRRVATDPGLSRTRLLATERDEEAFDDPPSGSAVIAVGPLSPSAQLELARAWLGERASAAADVLALLGRAGERPFDLIGSLRVLVATGAITPRGRGWRIDPARAAVALSGPAAGSVVRRGLEAHPSAEAVAQLLAVHGDGALPADLARAARLSERDVRAALGALAEAGLVQWTGEAAAFAHDRLRAEVLLAAPPAERRRVSGQLADALRQGGASPGDGERGMALLWLRQEAGLQDLDGGWWRDAFTEGALKAREIGDHAAAERFVASALQLAAGGAGFSYALLGEAAFAAITRGDHAEASRFADRMETYAATPAERAASDEMRVFARRASGDLDAALDVAQEVMARTGMRLPRRVTPLNLALGLIRVFRLDPRKAGRKLTAEELALEAPMMRAMNGIGSLLFERNPLLVILLVIRTLKPQVVYGTASGAGTYSLMCCAFGAYRRAAAWAEASDALQGPEQPLRAVAKQYSTNFGHVFVRPRPVTRTRGEEMAALAYAGGDLAVAAYGNRDTVLDALFSDDPLEATAERADEAIRVAERLGDAPTIPHVRALKQFLEQLRNGGPEGWRLDGADFPLAAQRQALRDEELANTARGVAALEALLGVLFGRYGEVALLNDRDWPKFGGAPFQAQTQIWAFATGLALYRTGKAPSRLARWNLGRLAKLNPNDFKHRACLLEAEHLRRRGRRRAALAAYNEAVEAASVSRCLLEHGLVAAASAEGAEALGAADTARLWRQAAVRAWRRLGADALLAARFGIGSAPDSAEEAEAVAAAREAAERANRAKSRLLATVGHELRTPLQGALGLLELAERPGEALDLANLRQAIQHLAGVVGDLTDLGALEGGVIRLRPAPMDANALAGSVVALHAAAAEAAGRSLVFRGAAAPVWVSGDEGRVRQVLGNLVANALRHGRGEVRVEMEQRPGLVVYRVADEGPQLEPETMRRVFEPFERGDGAADPAGLGVGLFLGRHLARAMGGDLTVTPTATGKAFELQIAAPLAPPPAELAGRGLAGQRVLLAEDTELSRRVLAALLRAEGCEVTEAADGDQAVAALADARFDLLLLDQRMPGQNGLEVAAAAAAGAEPPRMVLMTAGVDPDVEGRAAAVGIEAVLQKPVALAELRRFGAGGRRPGPDRIEELRRHLGADAEPLLAEVRPALEAELDALAGAIATGEPDEIAAQLHRLRGLAAHFGVEPVSAVLHVAGPSARPELVDELRAAAESFDWADWAKEPAPVA